MCVYIYREREREAARELGLRDPTDENTADFVVRHFALEISRSRFGKVFSRTAGSHSLQDSGPPTESRISQTRWTSPEY